MRHEIPQHPVFRPGTVDRDIWFEAIELNCYDLPDFFHPGDWVMNIGAHTGSVAWRCAMSGARVVCVETARENYHLLLHNLRPVWDRVIPINAAAWRSDQPATVLRFDANWTPANTGGGTVLGDAGGLGHDVVGVPLDLFLQMRPHWRMLVIDAEGSEFPCLYTSRELHRVQEIRGEYHDRGEPRAFADVGIPFCVESLTVHLIQAGFTVEVKEKGPGMGLFFARR